MEAPKILCLQILMEPKLRLIPKLECRLTGNVGPRIDFRISPNNYIPTFVIKIELPAIILLLATTILKFQLMWLAIKLTTFCFKQNLIPTALPTNLAKILLLPKHIINFSWQCNATSSNLVIRLKLKIDWRQMTRK